jgi:BirA family biotin operon repressor/biotin-[acetyl-CoA-carboxylase] ligase
LLKAFVKENRQHPTYAEKALWEMVKNDNLGCPFRRQHIIGDYIVDFVCLQKNLIVEIDGGYHAELEQKEYDRERTASLQRMGFKVIRFTNEEVIADTKHVLHRIQALMQHSPIMGGDGGGLLSIKWPNDIYYGNKKICGMLIENDLRGTCVENCVMGVGVNINQTEFEIASHLEEFRGAPTSLALILGDKVERRFVLESIMEHFTRYYEWTEQGRLEELHEMYLSHLYRIHEKHRFRDEKGEFCATITDVEPTGHLVLVDEHGAERRYAFKEVEYLI